MVKNFACLRSKATFNNGVTTKINQAMLSAYTADEKRLLAFLKNREFSMRKRSISATSVGLGRQPHRIE